MKLESPRELWSHGDDKVREFGKAFFVVLALVGAAAARRALAHHPVEPVHAVPDLSLKLAIVWEAAKVPWLSAWAVLTFACAFPWFVRPVYVALTLVGMAIGFAVGNVLLGATWLTLFVAIGRLRRASSPVELERDPARATYWKPHEKVRSSSRYYRQY